jgi:hypothetical protein
MTTSKDLFKERLPELGPFLFSSGAGEHSVFSGEHYFARVTIDDYIYFYTNETTRQKYLERGMKAWGTSPYLYQVPPEIVKDRFQLLEWAAEAIDVLTGLHNARQAAAKAKQEANREITPKEYFQQYGAAAFIQKYGVDPGTIGGRSFMEGYDIRDQRQASKPENEKTE